MDRFNCQETIVQILQDLLVFCLSAPPSILTQASTMIVSCSVQSSYVCNAVQTKDKFGEREINDLLAARIKEVMLLV